MTDLKTHIEKIKGYFVYIAGSAFEKSFTAVIAAAERCEAAEAELASLREDRERLDSGVIRLNHPPDVWGNRYTIHHGIDLRDAIDTARKEAAQ